MPFLPKDVTWGLQTLMAIGEAHFVNKGEGAGETLRLAGTDIRGMDKTDSHIERYASTLSLKRPHIANVGEDLEEINPWYAVVWNVHWCSHF